MNFIHKIIYTGLIAALFAYNIQIVKAQTQEPYLQFKKLDDLPNIMEWPATVTDGKYIYAINPYSNTALIYSVVRFDPHTGKWEIMNKKAGRKVQAAAAYLPADGHVYVFGGTESGHWKIFRGVQSIDVNTGVITDLNVYNPVQTAYGYAAAWDKLIYIFGGTQNIDHTIAALYSFDPQTLKFTQLADMPESLQTTGAIVNGVLYTLGGFDVFLNKQSNNINAYDIKTNTWRRVATLPQAISSNALAVCGDLIFVAGDYNDESFLGYFNTRNNTFTKLKSNMSGHRAGGAAIINNMLYVFGGKTYFKTAMGGLKTMEAADLKPILDSVSVSK